MGGDTTAPRKTAMPQKLEQLKVRLDQVAHCPVHFVRSLTCVPCIQAWDTYLTLWPFIEQHDAALRANPSCDGRSESDRIHNVEGLVMAVIRAAAVVPSGCSGGFTAAQDCPVHGPR